MRVDIRSRDHDAFLLATRATAYLDDEELPLCIMADEEEGEALVYLKHCDTIDLYGNDWSTAVTYIVRGNVRIELRDTQ